MSVDSNGWVICDGVKIGRRVQTEKGVKIQIVDKNPHRSRERGTRFVEVDPQELARVVGDE